VSASLSATADRLAAENARRTKERERDVWASAVIHWQQELDNRRLVYDEVAVAAARAAAAMTADNQRFGRPSFANAMDPSSISAAQQRWRSADQEEKTRLAAMNAAERFLQYSQQRLEQLDAALDERGAAVV
jgi:hypothetical protein